MNEKQRATIATDGAIDLPSDYDTPYTISHKLILDGADNFVLNTPLAVKFPTRLLWGADDKDVSRDVTLRLLDHMEGADIRLYIVKNADHGFSSPPCLGLIQKGDSSRSQPQGGENRGVCRYRRRARFYRNYVGWDE